MNDKDLVFHYPTSDKDGGEFIDGMYHPGIDAFSKICVDALGYTQYSPLSNPNAIHKLEVVKTTTKNKWYKVIINKIKNYFNNRKMNKDRAYTIKCNGNYKKK
jgi:ubiquitin-protein ligase